MIPFDEAQSLIEKHGLERKMVRIASADAVGMVLTHDISAPIDLPPFDNSAVDGFAVSVQSLRSHSGLQTTASLRAVAQEECFLEKDRAKKIMTGAPLPRGADAVVMKEDVALEEGIATFLRAVSVSDNVRFRGEDIARGSTVATAGTAVTPQLLGVFFGLGISELSVFRAPRVKIISTGDELVRAGEKLRFGQVYYLVGPMLKAQCEAMGVKDVSHEIVGDDQSAIEDAIDRSKDADVILLTGGMSKGDHDFVRPALSQSSVLEIFYQGAWRPGKPLYFGHKNDVRIFGLPGNPVACFVSFHIFVRPLILRAMGKSDVSIFSCAVLLNDFVKKPGFTFFARAKVNENNQLLIWPGQGSHQIFSLSQSNALCLLPAPVGIVKAGEVVHYYPI